MFDKNYTCSFAGPRPQHLPFKFSEEHTLCVYLKNRISETIDKAIEFGYTHFISGMAIGVDMWAAELVLSKKQEHNIVLECAIPCRNQPGKWAQKYRERYDTIIRRADHITVISEEYTDKCMQDRNKYMIDSASLLIAVYGGRGGGTGSTVKYAQKMGIETWVIDVLPDL